MSESVAKNIFRDTYRDFRKKVLGNKNLIYNPSFEDSDEYKELYNNGERRTKLYEYMLDVLKQYDESVSISRWRSRAPVWETGTNEQINREADRHPDIRIIFNVPAYLSANPEGARNYLRELLERNRETIEKEEDERKRLEDEQEQKLREQQEFKKKEDDDLRERIKESQEKAKVRKKATIAKMLETRARNKAAKEAKKAAEEEKKEEQLRGSKRMRDITPGESILKRKRLTEEQKKVAKELKEAKEKLQKLDSIGKEKVQTLLEKIEEAQEQKETDEEEEEPDENIIDLKTSFIPVETLMGANVDTSRDEKKAKTVQEMKKDLERKKMELEQKKAELEQKKAELEQGKIEKLNFKDLTFEQKNNRIMEVTGRLRFELEASGFSLDEINAFYTGILEEKERKEINGEITRIMRENDLGMTAQQYKRITSKSQALKRSKNVANNLSGAIGLERKNDQTPSEFIDDVSNTTNLLAQGMSPSMSAAEQKAQLYNNFESVSDRIVREAGDLRYSRVIYDLMRQNGVTNTIRDISSVIFPVVALTASGYRQTVRKRLGNAFANPLYISQNLIQRGYRNLARFFGNETDTTPEEPEEPDDEPERKQPLTDSRGIRITDSEDVLDFREESQMPRFTREEAARAKEQVKNVGVGAAAIAAGVQALRGGEEPITTKPVSSVIDNRPLTITREKITGKQTGQRSEGGKRKYSPQFIYPDDEILEPTEKQLSRNEYNLAKFDFINPDNVGGNNSNGDNPLYKANDTELAIRYFDWKNMVIEKENEFVKQLPPKVSDRIKKQFRRSFVEPAEPKQTRLNYMIHDDTQFAPFNSPYSEMTENTGTNPFIQTSVLYGSVP